MKNPYLDRPATGVEEKPILKKVRIYTKKEKVIELRSIDKSIFDKLLKVSTIIKPPKK